MVSEAPGQAEEREPVPHGVPTHLFCTGNQGAWHLQVKQHFRLGKEEPPGGGSVRDEQGLSRVFIKSFWRQPDLGGERPEVRQAADLDQRPILRRAWLDGDWEVYIGQAFQITHRHILKDAAPPPTSRST